MDKTRIFIADDHPFIRDGIKSVLSARKDFEVVGEADNGADALKAITELRPDMVIMDITMPQLNGIEASKRIIENAPETRIIIVSMHADVYHAIDAFRAGARAYVMKDASPSELLVAVEKVMAGSKYASPSVAEELLNDYVDSIKKEQSHDPFDSLTDREREILKHIAEGDTNKEIAGKLYISVATVKSHRNNIMKKLKVSDMASLVKVAIRKGLVIAE